MMRFCWKLRGDSAFQSAYRVRVASDAEGTTSESPDIWDSGRIKSQRTLFVPYGGCQLPAHATGYWSVTAYDEEGAASNPVISDRFSIAPDGDNRHKDWFGAAWIGAEAWDGPELKPAWIRSKRPDVPPEIDLSAEAPAVYLAKSFSLDRPVRRATLTLTGLGQFVAEINGIRCSAPLDPAYSAYDKTVLFCTYDVTALVRAGENAVLLVLGNSFFNLITPDHFGYERASWRGSPRALICLHIEHDDGSRTAVISDETWRATTSGPIRFNCIRGGETIDARQELTSPSNWQPAVICTRPQGTLRPQIMPPVSVSENRHPKRVAALAGGKTLVDFGGPLVGRIRLRTNGVSGSVISLRYGETRMPDDSLDLTAGATHTYGRYQHDRVILRGGKDEIFEPTFSLHAFRYVQIDGLQQPLAEADISAIRLHTGLRHTGRFDCSDPIIVRYHEAAQRTLEDCTFGLPCAEQVREKIAWCGDLTFELPAYFFLFDSYALYRNALREMIDSQSEDGHIPPIHPNGGWGRLDDKGGHTLCDDPWWGGSLAESAAGLGLYYADENTVAGAVEAAVRYVDYIASTRDARGLVTWNLGDWLDLEWKDCRAGLTDVAFTSTIGLVRLAQLAHESLSRAADSRAAQYLDLADQAAIALNQAYFKGDGYDGRSQTMQSLGILIGTLTVSQRHDAVQRIVDDIHRRGGQLSSGFIGLLPTMELLATEGHADLVLHALFAHTGSGILKSMELAGDPPTVGEAIHACLIDPHSGAGSFHHQFGATPAAFLYSSIAGLAPDPRSPGWRHFFIRPAIECGLKWLQVTFDSPAGVISVRWERHEEDVALDIEVPCNTTATFQCQSDQSAITLPPGRHRLVRRING